MARRKSTDRSKRTWKKPIHPLAVAIGGVVYQALRGESIQMTFDDSGRTELWTPQEIAAWEDRGSQGAHPTRPLSKKQLASIVDAREEIKREILEQSRQQLQQHTNHGELPDGFIEMIRGKRR